MSLGKDCVRLLTATTLETPTRRTQLPLGRTEPPPTHRRAWFVRAVRLRLGRQLAANAHNDPPKG